MGQPLALKDQQTLLPIKVFYKAIGALIAVMAFHKAKEAVIKYK